LWKAKNLEIEDVTVSSQLQLAKTLKRHFIAKAEFKG
jgi:hypothetical protein